MGLNFCDIKAANPQTLRMALLGCACDPDVLKTYEGWLRRGLRVKGATEPRVIVLAGNYTTQYLRDRMAQPDFDEYADWLAGDQNSFCLYCQCQVEPVQGKTVRLLLGKVSAWL